MTPAALIGYVLVPLFGVVMVISPIASRPTIPFGVRVPPAHLTAPVIRRERRGYQWRTAVVAVCATAVLIGIDSHASWPSRLILIGEILADLGCYWWAHQRITKVKAAEGWFAGQQRQTVVADTSWRTQPQHFPVAWLVPAAVVIVATVIVGILRYPQLPPYLASSGHPVATSPANAFATIFAQLYVTGIGSGLLALVYRSRPDLDTADPTASLRSYRKALGVFARATLIMLAGVDLTLLLNALQQWQVYRLPSYGAALILLPVALGLIALLTTAIRAGRERARATPTTSATDRDDDRFWKAGLIYVNRDDPAILVNARFAFGWTANFGNPAAWLLIAGVIAVPVGLVIIKFATGT
ncbi:MAG TPA: DUF5808 domain-containing protein [Pseudonocardiaceae bacterium]|jgi:uncharacterized membrane protein|nr:DUF5808 domain-containing protein [Pseudonocardiaceae bacterium]